MERRSLLMPNYRTIYWTRIRLVLFHFLAKQVERKVLPKVLKLLIWIQAMVTDITLVQNSYDLL